MATHSNLLLGFRRLPLPVAQLSLAAVLQCGQSFRWSIFPLVDTTRGEGNGQQLPSHEYRLCLRDRVVCLRQGPEDLYYRSVLPQGPLTEVDQELKEAETLAWINDYFQLKVDLMRLYGDWAERDPVFLKLKDRFSGIRMLRQDPFECLLSFICSSNNNITRITKMVKSLCKEYSTALIFLAPPPESIHGTDDLEPYYPFPSPSSLAGPEVAARLRSLGFGYRAEFIQKTAKMLVDAHGAAPSTNSLREPAEIWLQTLRDMDTVTARAELLKLMGVGRKVADCILLMSLDKAEVVPVDTHVHQIAIKHYGMSGTKAKTNMTPALYEQVNTKLVGVWGEYAGWAHSVLFTSDLKSFSSYGLLPSPGSGSLTPASHSVSEEPAFVPHSPRKRKVREVKRQITAVSTDSQVSVITTESVVNNEECALDGELSLADRVKRRRRGKTGI